MLAYIAGPLFNEGERWFVEKICAQAEAAGFETFLPHRDTPPEYVIPRNPAAIFRSDLDYLERAALVVANLNGITSDDGTAWELGYAYARGVGTLVPAGLLPKPAPDLRRGSRDQT